MVDSRFIMPPRRIEKASTSLNGPAWPPRMSIEGKPSPPRVLILQSPPIMDPRIDHHLQLFSAIYLGGIPSIITNDSSFLSFISMLSAMEALAGFRYATTENDSGKRFETFVRDYYPPEYHEFSYGRWRCPMEIQERSLIGRSPCSLSSSKKQRSAARSLRDHSGPSRRDHAGFPRQSGASSGRVIKAAARSSAARAAAVKPVFWSSIT